MDKNDINTLAAAYELLRGAQLDGLTGEQTVVAGNTILAFRDLIQAEIDALNEGGDENESQD